MPIMLHGLSDKVRLMGVTIRRHRPTHDLLSANQLSIIATFDETLKNFILTSGIPEANFPPVMNRKLLKSKIHRATVTDANLEYEGSVTLDGSLMEEAGIVEHEHVCIWNLANGARIETYALLGEPGSGIVCINGAAVHHVKTGEKVIIASYGYYNEEEAKTHSPKVILVDSENRVRSAK